MKIIKRLLILIVVCAILSFVFGFLLAYAGSIVIPRFWRIDSDFQLGYAGDLLWLFFIGGFVGLIPGVIVALKIWQKIK